jgi:predicted nucleic acid-binding protein
MTWIEINQDSEVIKKLSNKDLQNSCLLIDSNVLIHWKSSKNKGGNVRVSQALERIIDRFQIQLIRNVVIQQELMNYILESRISDWIDEYRKSKGQNYEWLCFTDQKIKVNDKHIKILRKKKPSALKEALENLSEEMSVFNEISSYQTSQTINFAESPSWEDAELLARKFILNSNDAMIANFVERADSIEGLITCDRDFQSYGEKTPKLVIFIKP